MGNSYTVQRQRLRNHATALREEKAVWQNEPNIAEIDWSAFTMAGQDAASQLSGIVAQYQNYGKEIAEKLEEIASGLDRVVNNYGKAEKIIKDYLS